MSDPHQQAAQDVLRWLAGGLLAGASARAAQGALATTVGRPPFTPAPQKPVLVRVPREAGDDDDVPPAPSLGPRKVAADDWGEGFAAFLNELSPGTAALWEAEKRAMTETGADISRFLHKVSPDIGRVFDNYVPEYRSPLGETATNSEQVPWKQVGRFLAPGAGLVGGYALADKPVNALVEGRDRREVDKAREEYYQALAAAVAQNRKAAAALPNADGLVALAGAFDAFFEKAALDPGAEPNEGGIGVGYDILKRLLFPLNNLGTAGASATLGLAGTAGAYGAMRQYQDARSLSLPRLVSREAERIKAEDEGEPPVALAFDPKRTVQLTP